MQRVSEGGNGATSEGAGMHFASGALTIGYRCRARRWGFVSSELDGPRATVAEKRKGRWGWELCKKGREQIGKDQLRFAGEMAQQSGRGGGGERRSKRAVLFQPNARYEFLETIEAKRLRKRPHAHASRRMWNVRVQRHTLAE